jgi:AraC-like DNA-binding protein
MVADNIQSETWDMAKFHLNFIIPHKLDQALNVLQIYFYSASLWYLIWKYKRSSSNRIYNVPQYKLIRNWLFIFTLIITIITLNFTVAMANMWIYDDKSIFLQKASGALLFASIVYVGMNMTVMIFPHIMYGLPLDLVFKPLGSSAISLPEVVQLPVAENKASLQDDATNNTIKSESQFFTPQYIEKIETHLQERIEKQKYLETNCGLSKISDDVGIPAHHLTYYFNTIKKQSFSDWRNQLRVEHAKILINQGATGALSLQGVAISSGFSSQSTFIRAFKNVTGSNPSEYLKNITK